MSKVIASLSDLAWVDSPETILSKLLGYYILTDAAQSVIFQGNLINLPQTYYQYINDPDGMATQIRIDLDKLLSRYFEAVEIITEAVAKTESIYSVLIFATAISSDGVKVSLGKVTELSSSGVSRVIDINNYGDGLGLLR